ncbi:MAG TPA: hypothetical protein VHV08_05550 [Pirellulales bacterium]|jgi:hypothetical protein|nr:hypothetical protein [Pirellulales bacterium]
MIRASMMTLGGMLLLAGITWADEKPADQTAKPAPTQEELEKQFAATMSGATLVGNFTLTGQKGDEPLKTDRYTLGEVKKLKNGYWSFSTRIQYGDHDVTVPLALQVAWAGDTPVITLTDVAVPGLGTFTSRVLVYRDQYAGTWSHGEHGGHLFGKIVRDTGETKASSKPATGAP